MTAIELDRVEERTEQKKEVVQRTVLEWPFVREYAGWSEVTDLWRWRVGAACYEKHDDCEWLAHGVGACVLTYVADLPMPRPYQARVAFTRTWIDPDGHHFGKKAIRFISRGAYSRLLRGHLKPFSLVSDYAPVMPGAGLNEHITCGALPPKVGQDTGGETP